MTLDEKERKAISDLLQKYDRLVAAGDALSVRLQEASRCSAATHLNESYCFADPRCWDSSEKADEAALLTWAEVRKEQ